ncbi:MAG: phosphopantetheine-binding protein [Caulobacter sp.]|nr:phosphopantetheine-binding protein [Caulobacter sp.]
MTRDEIMEGLTECVRTVFDEYEGPVGPELNAEHVSQWDSLANVQLFVMVEQVLGVRFTTEEFSGLKNLGELADLVAAKQA